MRAALYWAPAQNDPLFAAGNAWLGRDPETGATLKQPDVPGLPDATRDARQYGFHATLRPPMRLSTGWPEFLAAAHRIAASRQAFLLPPLKIENLDGFLALVEAAPCAELRALADACVEQTNPHRLAPTDAEFARRRAGGLTEEEESLLQRWGYPHVFQRWRFHMTLTRRLPPGEVPAMLHAASLHFAGLLEASRLVAEIAIFTQRLLPAPLPFLIAERVKLKA